MAVYMVKLPASAKNILQEGVDVMVVEAASSGAAITAAQGASNSINDTAWADATATQLTGGTVYLQARFVA
jgi:hypothetical protein